MYVRLPNLADPAAMTLPVANGHQVYVPGVSAAMRAVERVIADIAPTDIPVLLVGESGTGKEVVAGQIHRLSARRDLPLVRLICATLTSEQLLGRNGGNGHEVDAASLMRGTVLLDEITELEAQVQPKLLHALAESEDMPPGMVAGARLICTTSRNLEEEMRGGRFREELYYRINGVCLRLPPLRQRREDIPVLADYFLTKYSALYGRELLQLSRGVMARLMDYAWPGNVREMENRLKRAVALGDEHAVMADAAERFHEAPGSKRPAPLPETISLKEASRAASRQAERELILKVLGRTRWNRKRAAQELRISYKALLYKLKQIGLDEGAGL